VYVIETGEVYAYNPRNEQFEPLHEAVPGTVPPPTRLTPAHSI
jgi:hypothetical protein